jgi:hypothetical protein
MFAFGARRFETDPGQFRTEDLGINRLKHEGFERTLPLDILPCETVQNPAGDRSLRLGEGSNQIEYFGVDYRRIMLLLSLLWAILSM